MHWSWEGTGGREERIYLDRLWPFSEFKTGTQNSNSYGAKCIASMSNRPSGELLGAAMCLAYREGAALLS